MAFRSRPRGIGRGANPYVPVHNIPMSPRIKARFGDMPSPASPRNSIMRQFGRGIGNMYQSPLLRKLLMSAGIAGGGGYAVNQLLDDIRGAIQAAQPGSPETASAESLADAIRTRNRAFSGGR